MNNNFRPEVNIADIKKAEQAGNTDELYDLLVQPLHEQLYKEGSFDFITKISSAQLLLLSYDYVRAQVGQGGFIQFLHNGYVSLLPDMIEELYKLNAPAMAKILDDVLKVYVLNRELITKDATVQEFALLYDELKEFEEIEVRFNAHNKETVGVMLSYALSHLNEFIAK